MATCAGVMHTRIIRIDRIPGRSVTTRAMVVAVHADHVGMVNGCGMIASKEPVTGVAGIGGGNCRTLLAGGRSGQGPGCVVAVDASSMFFRIGTTKGDAIGVALCPGMAIGTISG